MSATPTRASTGASPTEALPVALVRSFGRAIDRVRLLGRLMAGNAAAERVRLLADLERGMPSLPRWMPVEHGQLPDAAAFAAMAAAFDDIAGAGDPLAALYAARARELELEVELVVARGSVRFAQLARERHPHRGALSDRATALSRQWLAEQSVDEGHGESDRESERLTSSDDERDPSSLVSRMRAEVAGARLPFRVHVSAELAPLAATGEEVIHVCAGRRLGAADVERTVLHEIEAHARPRAEARRRSEPIFALGTARGTDDQEGRALLLEERAGHLTLARRRALARRHLACVAMRDGADFVGVVRALVDEQGATAREAVVVGERVFRGSDGTFPGLGREQAYLEAYLDLRRALRVDPSLESVIAAGQVSLAAAPTLRTLL